MNHGQCIPCSDYCNGHAHICLDKYDSDQFDININDHNTVPLQNDGPISDAICFNCTDNTTGPTCSGCLPGHFRGSEDFRDPCRYVFIQTILSNFTSTK